MTAYVVGATPVTASPARARRTPLCGTPLGVKAGVTKEESGELRERNRQLEQENEILRRAAAYFAQAVNPR